MSIGLCFGLSMGMLLFRNMTIGMCVGMMLGLSIGAGKDAREKERIAALKQQKYGKCEE